MASPTIHNNNQAWTQGASWLNTYLSNQYSQETCDFQNNSNILLYPGDVVIIGDSTSGSFVADPTALGVTTTTTANSPLVVGVVGGEAYNPGSITQTPATVGGLGQPAVDYATTQIAVGFTNGSTNLTSALVSTVNPFVVGQLVNTVYNSSTNANPQIFQVTGIGGSSGSWTATSVVVSGTGTSFSGTTGAYGSYLTPPQSNVGPGFPGNLGSGTPGAAAYVPGAIVPVVTAGWAYVNIGTNTVAAGAVVATGTTAAQAAAPSVATYVASSPGTFIGVALEAQSAGIASQNPLTATAKLIRCWVTKM